MMKHHKPWIVAALNLLLFYIFLIIEDMRHPQYSQYLKRFERPGFREQKCDAI